MLWSVEISSDGMVGRRPCVVKETKLSISQAIFSTLFERGKDPSIWVYVHDSCSFVSLRLSTEF
jgi:hypothetical protein